MSQFESCDICIFLPYAMSKNCFFLNGLRQDGAQLPAVWSTATGFESMPMEHLTMRTYLPPSSISLPWEMTEGWTWQKVDIWRSVILICKNDTRWLRMFRWRTGLTARSWKLRLEMVVEMEIEILEFVVVETNPFVSSNPNVILTQQTY